MVGLEILVRIHTGKRLEFLQTAEWFENQLKKINGGECVDLTVFEAVEEAGSFTRSASLGRVILVRGDLKDPQVLDINLRDVIKKGIKEKDLYIQPDDIIYVPPNGFAKAGYAVEQVLFPFRPILGVGRELTFVDALQETF